MMDDHGKPRIADCLAAAAVAVLEAAEPEAKTALSFATAAAWREGALDAAYGELPAHGGLWEAAENTADDLAARLAVVPRCWKPAAST